jgi:integrase/recombinase XerD
MNDEPLLGPWVRRFLLEHLVAERNLARNTQRSYRDALTLLIPFAAAQLHQTVDRLQVVDVSADLVRLFLADLEQTRQCAITTRNQRLAAVHALARFVGEHSPEHIAWCGQIRSVPFKKASKTVIPYLDKPQMDALLAAPDRGTAQGRRDHALLLFLYNSGSRAQEAAQLLVGELALAGGSVKIRGKGGKERHCPLWPSTVAEITVLIADRAPTSPVFLNRCGHQITRFGVHTLVERYVLKAQIQMPSLATKRISPHTIRHYLPFRTMSGSQRALRIWTGKFRSHPVRPRRWRDIVRCRLQTVQEREESVARLIPAGFCIRRGGPRKGFLLHGKCRFEVNLRGFNTFATEPQRDYRTVDACLQQVHGRGVPQAMDSNPFVFQGGAQVGGRRTMLVQQVLHAVDAEAFTLSVGEQHLSVTALGLVQPGFQDGEYRSGDGRTAFLAPLTNYPHVGAGAEDEVFAFETGHLG